MEKLQVLSLYANFRKDLNYIEKELECSVDSASPIIRQASLHLLRAGGKRIRPIFVLLASEFGQFSLERVAKVAVSLELVHMASLVHDDVIDNSDMRRGHPTVKAKWNNRIAMYTGDYIFAQALVSIADIKNAAVHQLLAKTMLEICEGEIIQIEHQRVVNQTVRDYLRRIKRKTALLLSSSCELGALVSGAEPAVVNKLSRFGYYAGMSFQITDDILDLTSTDEELGKPAGSDLLNGHLTLPIFYLKDDPAFQPYMEQAFSGNLTEQAREDMLAYVRSSGAIEKAAAVSDLYLQKAKHEIRALPEGKAKKSFIQIAEFIGKRNY
ncbi:polyprenyl synthetase family protein [Sporosarcina pasteurii]|uniref:Heptaprenyl diphosphate synthase component 2 n=1 Tax=Sporosarcina pasteurii TaxID=1474 RepID=A0A380BLY8_SPOPA|nr:polyprenyl synthetase family protein [Sporosarcina pasteurii]MDS9470820.1 polyprenyl synthetase family protein [Sporosarcina pasteurii]QBQ05512.1 heptaprenyl diphosphate synthase [Sporosarcina pasteurii]SUJ02561.1 Heptaprenyl diphosphate synthase component 2 [Sporosarcina pasteurii]